MQFKMVQVPQAYPLVQEPAIATFDFQDIANGLGFSIFHFTTSEDDSFKKFVLASTPLIAATTDGLIATGSTYEFRSSAFNLPRTAKGTAYLSGYADYTSGGGIIANAKLSIESGTLSADGKGSIVWSSTGEVSTIEVTYQLKKTITIDGFVHEITSEIKTTTTTCSARYRFFYEGGQIVDVIQTTSSGTYVAKTTTNPNQTKRVYKIEVWIKIGGGGGTAFEKETNVYEENTSGLTTTDITSSITSATMAADQGLLMELPLTQTRIKKGDNLLLKFVASGGTGGFVVDPTAEVHTKESLKLNLPFRIDL